MAVHRASGEVIFECDECGEEYPGGTLSFQEVVDELKADGWRIRKDEETGEWTHECPECK